MSKKLFLLLPMLMMGALIMVNTGCGDKCGKKDCGNGICDEVDGSCNCDPGYEYDADGSCLVKTQDKYVASYNIHDDCTSGVDDYVGSVSANADVTKVNFFKVWNLFTNAVVASIDGTSVTIARQEPDSDGYFVEGTGTFAVVNNKDVITLTIKVTKELNGTVLSTDNCTTKWTKQ